MTDLTDEQLEEIKARAIAHMKPCPFCGSGAVRAFHDGDHHVIQCAQCGCEISHTQHHKVVAAWNRRVPDADLVEAMDDLLSVAQVYCSDEKEVMDAVKNARRAAFQAKGGFRDA